MQSFLRLCTRTRCRAGDKVFTKSAPSALKDNDGYGSMSTRGTRIMDRGWLTKEGFLASGSVTVAGHRVILYTCTVKQYKKLS